MLRIAVFTPHSHALEAWRPWLEQTYEATFVSTDQSLIALIDAWRPDLIIYHEPKIRHEFLKMVSEKFRMQRPGFVVVASIYNMREELAAFEAGADHYLLSSTPIESVKARIENLVAKKMASKELKEVQTGIISLPQKGVPLRYKDILIYPDQNCVRLNENTFRITPTQTHLLYAFVHHAGQLLTREWLQTHVFHGAGISARSIDAQLAKLKKAIPYLKTELISVYGKGYVLKADESKAA